MNVAAPAVAITGVGLAVPGLAEAGELLEPAAPGIDAPGGFDPAVDLSGWEMRNKDRASRLALYSAAAALRDAGLYEKERSGPDEGTRFRDGTGFQGRPDATAVVVSTNLAMVDTVCQAADTIAGETVVALNPMLLPATSSNAVAGWVAIRYGLRGPSLTICNGATGGLDALHWARMLIAAGRAECVLVVGVEPTGDAAAKLVGQAGRDARRCADVAAAVVVEPVPAARARGARVCGVVAGYARAADAPGAMTAVRRLRRREIGVWLADSAMLSARAEPKARLDIEARLGHCSGALGILQIVAAAAYFARGGTGDALALAGGDVKDDAAAAVVLAAPGRIAAE